MDENKKLVHFVFKNVRCVEEFANHPTGRKSSSFITMLKALGLGEAADELDRRTRDLRYSICTNWYKVVQKSNRLPVRRVTAKTLLPGPYVSG